ncbi:MAG: hypothetical protein H6Q58_810 [Firmicutes bacterium]|nr:hypothetical protein [Bacillota bacterium]
MFENLLTSSITESTFTLQSVAEISASAILLGLVISLVYIKTNKNNGFTPGFATTLIMLPLIISIIILMVGNNIARAFSLAGAFSIIRFRSVPGEPRDISYVLFTLAIGLSCGMGYIGYGAIFTAILCLLMIALDVTKYGKPKGTGMHLKIMVPEEMDYENAFDDIFSRYAHTWKLQHIKSKDGTNPELVYTIHLMEGVEKKKFLDELRERNGHLHISISLADYEEKAFG